MASPTVPPGWYADPWSPGQHRWWDGGAWAAATQAAAQPSIGQRLRVPSRVVGPGSATVFAVTGVLTVLFLLIELGPGAFVVASVAAVLPLPLYAWAALLLDRLHPEPKAALVWTFTAGATAVVLFAVIVNSTTAAVLDATVGVPTSDVLTSTLVAPVVEELGKAVVLVLLYRRFRHEISGPLDGVVYATMVGLGFATVENILYYGQSVADGSLPVVFVLRGVLSPFAHPLFTAAFGIGLGLLAAGRTRRVAGAPVLGLLLAVGLHALWNGSTDFGAGGVLLMFFGLMVPVFFAMVVLCRKEARREQRRIRHHLRPEVEAGVLSESDVHVLSDVAARRRLLKAARRAHPRAGAAARELAADLLELASIRDRIASGAFSDRYGRPDDVVATLTTRLGQSRWALPPALPEAPWAGLSGVFGVPLPPRPPATV
jgi:RsiW-degrading membrane proteinase PrsW (M82 family)